MVGHLDRGRSVAGQARAVRRPAPSPRRGPAASRLLGAKGPRNEGAPLAGKPCSDALNCFDLLWPFSLIARHELFRTSQNE
jgi:hypothetical protein